MGLPHDMLNGQRVVISSAYLADNSVGAGEIGTGAVASAEIAANAVGQSELSSSALAAKYKAAKSITFSGGLKTVTTTGYTPSMVTFIPKDNGKAATQYVAIAASTIVGSTVSIAGTRLSASGGVSTAAAITGCFYVIAW